MRSFWRAAALVVASLGCGSAPVGESRSDASDPAPLTAEAHRDSETTSPSVTTVVASTGDPDSAEDAAIIDAPTQPHRSDDASSPVTPAPHVETAVAVVERHGYEPTSTTDIAGAPVGGLHVIIGRSARAPHDRHQAFFFLGDRFVGTDLADSSRSIDLAWRAPDTIALAYDVYRPDDKICCPTGGAIIVRYGWEGKEIVPLDPVPSADERR